MDKTLPKHLEGAQLWAWMAEDPPHHPGILAGGIVQANGSVLMAPLVSGHPQVAEKQRLTARAMAARTGKRVHLVRFRVAAVEEEIVPEGG